MSGDITCLSSDRFFRPSTRKIERTQRFPIYSDEEMIPIFEQISKGYCYKQASAICLYPAEWVLNTMYSDDDIGGYLLDLSMVAGSLIRSGLLAPPLDRWDGLYGT